MEEACKELDEMRTELEKLKVEYKAKCQHSESLRRALDEQLIKFQKASVESEQQAKEIDAKSEEIAVAKQKYEDLLSNFKEKESILKHLSLASEITRTGLKEQIKKLEQLNMDLVSSLDEATVKAEKQENMVCKYKKEVEGLERLLSESKKKYSDAELRAQAPKEVRRRDEMLDELVREKEEIEDRLKWKFEQFRHLEEALFKVQGEFRAGKEEWATEKSHLLNDITSLQSSLDSQTQVSKDLRSQLQMCNQALASEESRRRLLEIQMSESKEMYENIVFEYEEVKSNIATLTARRDEEIASLRNSMTEKNMLIKELDYKSTYFKQENQELLEQIKEAQEAQINGQDTSASLKSLHQKFRALELAHKVCPDKLKAREGDWSRQMKRATEEIDDCMLKLNSKDHEISLLEKELDYNHCLLIQTRKEKEEMSVINLILDSKFTDICFDLKGYEVEMNLSMGRAEERATFLTKQLENKSIVLTQALEDVFEERKKVHFLQSKVEQIESVNEEFHSMQKELASSKGMIAKLSRNIDSVKEQAAQKELDLLENLQSTSCALEKAESFISEKIGTLNDVEFELQLQRNVVMQLKKIKCDLEFELKECHCESQEVKRSMNYAILEKMEMEKVLMETKENLFQLLEEKVKIAFELEIVNVIMEEYLAWMNLENFAFVELKKLNDVFEKLKSSQIIDKHELEFKSLLIAELEKGIIALQSKLDSEEKLSSNLENSIQKLQAKSAAEKFHLENELERICSNQKSLEEKFEVESKKQNLHDTIGKLSQQRELQIEQMLGLGDLIGKLSIEGDGVRKNWDRILQKFIFGVNTAMDMERDDLISCKMTHGRKHTSSHRDKAGESPDRKSPLKELNIIF